MPINQIRYIMIPFVAVIFGIVQILCVCSAQAAPLSPQTATMPMVHNDAYVHHENTAHDQLPSEIEHHHDQGHDHDGNDCAHCSGDLAFASSADGASASKMAASSSDLKTLLSSIAAPSTPANLAPSALNGLRWLDPPRPTLISQKVLLLI
jgi:hypothetical protein